MVIVQLLLIRSRFFWLWLVEYHVQLSYGNTTLSFVNDILVISALRVLKYCFWLQPLVIVYYSQVFLCYSVLFFKPTTDDRYIEKSQRLFGFNNQGVRGIRASLQLSSKSRYGCNKYSEGGICKFMLRQNQFKISFREILSSYGLSLSRKCISPGLLSFLHGKFDLASDTCRRNVLLPPE